MTWLQQRLAAHEDDVATTRRASPVWRARPCPAVSQVWGRGVRAR
jgi:hypothetical protein